MKYLYFILTVPFFIFAVLFNKFNVDNFQDDLKKCQIDLANIADFIDSEITKILYLAEDHRCSKHFGIDHYAMLRAIYYTKFKKQFQGGSTIAQQYVRVMTQRYERTWRRKFREQLLAVLISRKFSAEQISSAYLKIAFLGSGMHGLNDYLRWKKITHELNTLEKIEIISRLKYPEPLNTNEEWSSKIKIRVGNILSKLAKSLPTSLCKR